ncbi:MAG: peptidyl-tRNA hydrolase Pth2 [Candidatus Marsarchaeota archaeon]|nr:peptidyl-tRNA hydrolase Pth2 [Candidatus Marsarchaeota archaeon]
MANSSEIKQVIIIRADVKMGRGKIAAQASHASLMSYFAVEKIDSDVASKWLEEGEKKIILKIEGEREMVDLYKRLKSEKIPCVMVIDAGLTEVPPGTKTAIGIGPWYEDKVNKFTAVLKLL